MNARQMNYWNVTLRALAGRDDVTAYTLRHSHASLLHYASFTIPEAARRMGHSQIVHLRHYAHALEGLQGKRYADLDAAITAASAPAVAQRLPAER
jgi:integrase